MTRPVVGNLDVFDSVSEVFRERTEACPERALLHFEGSSITRRELFQRACRIAHLPGTGGGRRVGVVTDCVPDAVAILLGCSLAGDTFVGLGPYGRHERLAVDAVDLLVVEPRFAPLLDDDTFHAHVEGGSFLVVDSEAPPGLVEPSESWSTALAGCAADDPDLAPEPGDTLAVTVTTSGQPQPWSHAAVLAAAGEAVRSLDLDPHDLGWCGSSPGRPAGLLYGVVAALLADCSLVAARRPTAARFLRDAVDHGCTWLAFEGEMLEEVLGGHGAPARIRSGAAVGTGAFGCVAFDAPVGAR